MDAPGFDEVLDMLHEIAPLELAAEWDNVGLLLQPHEQPGQVAKVLLTIDLTDAVVDEAVRLRRRPGRVLSPADLSAARASEHDRPGPAPRAARAAGGALPVYSPHTALDAAPGGLADWLIEGALGDDVPTEVRPCGEGEYGRVAELSRGIAWSALLDRIKQLFGVSHLQIAKPPGTGKVRSIAVAAGAGSGVLRGTPADVYVTGEMSHHDALAAVAAGTAVVLAGHSNTERGFLRLLKKRLTTEFGKALDVRVSKVDKDPLTTA